jgi:hypothetical protein
VRRIIVRVTEARSVAARRPTFALWTAAAILAAAVALPVARAQRPASVLTGVLACAIASGLAWWAARLGERAAATAMITAAGLWAGEVGWLATVLLDRVAVVALAVAATCAAAAVAVASRLIGVGRALATALAVAAVATAATAGLIVAGVDARQPVRILPAIVVLGIGLLPRFALGAGGMAEASFRLRARAASDAVDPVIAVAEQYLLGGLIGLGAVAGCCVTILVGSGGVADVWLGLGLGALLWSRSRLFAWTAQMLPLRLAGIAAVLAGAARLLAGEPDSAWGLAVVLALVAGVTVLAGTRRRPAGRWPRLGELAVAFVTVAALVAATGVVDLAGVVAARSGP